MATQSKINKHLGRAGCVRFTDREQAIAYLRALPARYCGSVTTMDYAWVCRYRLHGCK